MTARTRDVLLSLVQAAKDDVSRQLKIAKDPNNYQARAVKHMDKLLKVYLDCETELMEIK